ncbi:MAG TPA: energy-coupling factor ABC transporter ATP-binding protein [Phycisphaerae bacterium]|nr:energy-coupling factor ABC transporter ATP-binding protein [Phycisphaerae bacterium]
MPPAIELRSLHYSFPDGTHALRGISASIPQNSTTALIGPNGAGKSTLLLHLNALLPGDASAKHSSGEVLILGTSTRTASPADLRKIRHTVGLVFQDPNDQLFCPTVYEDVAFGPQQLALSKADIKSRVEKALAAVHLEGFESRLPHHLSVGEKRRVCIAGVLACEPQILILDEPTSNLDPRGRRELKTLLRALPLTKIIATHDLELVVELCPDTLLLSKGQIIAHGPTLPMLSDETLMQSHGLEKPHILMHQHPHLPQINLGTPIS